MTPVQVRIKMNDGYRAKAVQATKNRNGDTMVTTNGYGQHTLVDQAAYHLFGLAVVAGKIAKIRRNIAQIHHFDGLSIKNCSTDIKIVSIQGLAKSHGGTSHRCGRIGLVVD